VTQSKPPITGTTHTLPFDRLSPRDFERLCLWLVEREGYKRAEHLGAAGREQGRDIVAWREGQLWAFQCKRVQHFGPADAAAEVGKVLGLPDDDRPLGLIFIVACDVSDETRRQARARCGRMKCDFWALTELDERAKRHADIVEEFFQLGAALSEGIPPPLHQLPADLADFTGREEEMRELVAVLGGEGAGAAISAIGGMGGIGKTALAVHVAHELSSRYPDAQIVVDLQGTKERALTTAEAMGQVIRAFEPEARVPDAERQAAALYRSTLTGRQALILFDDAADGAQVRPLLPPSSCGVIVTSRRSIALPGMEPFNLEILSEGEAGELLQGIVGQGRATGAELDEIARLCGRLPLALRAAGSFLAVHPDWSAGEYIEALTGERERLARLVHEDVDVEAALGLSAAQLTRERAELAAGWQMLSVFPAPFDRAAAASVWGVEAGEARDRLSELAVRSLLLYDTESGLYRFHDLMRPVAENTFGYGGGEPDREAERGRLAAAADRHAAHYLEMGARADDLYAQGGDGVLAGLRKFDAAWPHLQAAFARVQGRDDKPAARWLSQLDGRMASVLHLRLPPHERIPVLEAALSAARRLGDRLGKEVHLGNLGTVYADLGDARRAIGYYEQALEIARQIGNRRHEGNHLGNLGNTYFLLGNTQWSIGCYEQALEIAREIGDRRGEEGRLGSLGNACLDLGDARRAIGYYEQALEIARQIGDRLGEGNALSNLGRAYFELGDTRRAIGYYGQALEIDREIGDRRGESADLGNLGLAYVALPEAQQAIDYYEQALEIAREIGDRRNEGAWLGSLGNAYVRLGDARRAIGYHEQALEIAREIGHRHLEGNTLANLGLLAEEQGDFAHARELWENALRIFKAIEDPGAERVRELLAGLGERAESHASD
jgi:tetratricopeptide (TPR) repeat protein